MCETQLAGAKCGSWNTNTIKTFQDFPAMYILAHIQAIVTGKPFKFDSIAKSYWMKIKVVKWVKKWGDTGETNLYCLEVDFSQTVNKLWQWGVVGYGKWTVLPVCCVTCHSNPKRTVLQFCGSYPTFCCLVLLAFWFVCWKTLLMNKQIVSPLWEFWNQVKFWKDNEHQYIITSSTWIQRKNFKALVQYFMWYSVWTLFGKTKQYQLNIA